MTTTPTPAIEAGISDERLKACSDDLQALYDWMREPDWAEKFGTKETIVWLNARRPGIVLVAKAYVDGLAALRSTEAASSGVRDGWPEPKIVNPDIGSLTGNPYIDCLIHRLLDAQQDINLAANEGMSQSLCDASALIDEVETALRKGFASPIPPSAPKEPSGASQGEGWQTIDSAPKDGTEIIGFRPDQGVFVFRWAWMEEFVPKDQNGDPTEEYDDTFACWWHDRWNWMEGELTPTLWIPLPAPPATGAKP